ncbi:unnamed protein product [Onchocerca flexuosa]|uniref:Integrin_alpha2 domain-containing protein n=1 Tax=Onchocerca flexuosa TaxID=387005 RepID=A0A183HHH5_9BILA|nr:unnamed protein product [Onchocerca flexuosa]
MLGATVRVSKKGDSVVVCAPHYKYFFSKFEVVEPVGTCFYATNGFENIEEFASCRQEPARHGHHRFGYGMCGFSASIPDDGKEKLYIGAPGAYYWQGTVFAQNIRNQSDRPNTNDGPAHHDNYNLGKLKKKKKKMHLNLNFSICDPTLYKNNKLHLIN